MNRMLFALLLGAAVTPAGAADDAWKLLPEQPLLYVQASDPAGFANYLLQHPVRKKLDASPVYQQAYKTPQYQKFQVGLAFVESQLGRKWHEALESLAGNGVHLAFDPRTEGAVLIVRAKDAAYADEMSDQLRKWTQHLDKQAKVDEYRGVKVTRAKDGATSAVWDGWIALSNKPKLLQQVIDRQKDGGRSLVDNQQFAEAAGQCGDSVAWAYVDLQMLRASGQAKQIFSGQADNPGAELLIGGVMSTLQHTNYVVATLKARGPHLQLAAEMPHRAEWGKGPREHFFGPDGKGAAPAPLKVDGVLFSLATYRDIARMWLQADDLFSEDTVDGLAQADSNLSTLFGGRDFGEDILASLKPEVQLIAARQAFDSLPRPAIRLPGFALVAKLKEPESMQKDLRRTYQSLIGFLNIIGAQQGNPQLDMEAEKVGATQIHRATFVPEPEEEKSETARIHFNFSPAIAFNGERVVFSSSAELAKQLAVAAELQPTKDNTKAQLNVGALREVLEDNKAQLIAQNILEKGHTRQEAQAEIETAFDLASLVESIRLRLTATDSLRLQLDATLAP